MTTSELAELWAHRKAGVAFAATDWPDREGNHAGDTDTTLVLAIVVPHRAMVIDASMVGASGAPSSCRFHLSCQGGV